VIVFGLVVRNAGVIDTTYSLPLPPRLTMTSTASGSVLPAGGAGNYILFKTRKQLELKQVLEDLKNRHVLAVERKKKTDDSYFLGIFKTWESSRNEVDNYWQDDHHQNMEKVDVYSAMVLQQAFVFWTSLSLVRKRLKQIRLRQQQKDARLKSLTMSRMQQELLENKQREELEYLLKRERKFKEFCRRLTSPGGEPVNLVHPYDGSTKKCLLRFDADFRNLVYNGSGWLPSKIPLDSIYSVAKGLPEMVRAMAATAHHPWCLHIKFSGGEFMFEAANSDSARTCYDGLVEIHKRIFSMESFFIDSSGAVRRRCTSVIADAIKN
jgi:hypothetical protein